MNLQWNLNLNPESEPDVECYGHSGGPESDSQSAATEPAQIRYATHFINPAVTDIAPCTGFGSRAAPDWAASSAWRASSSFICETTARDRSSASGRLSRCESRWASTWRSVASTKPRLHLSPARPAAAPIAKEPAYHRGFRRLDWLPSASRRSAHQRRWSISSRAACSISTRTFGSLAVTAWPA